MIKNIQQEDNLLIAEAVDFITKDDVQSVMPVIEEMIKKYKEINCLMIITKMKGYTIDGLLADFEFYFKHKDFFNYMALVGDKKFAQSIIKFINIFYPNKFKYFAPKELVVAKKWIKNFCS